MTTANQPLEALHVPSRLASTPKGRPRFPVPVQLGSGEALMVGDPRATRAMVALMDMNALQGGAASHFGGPSAFAELMSAAHGLMYHRATKAGVEWHEAFHFVNDAGHCENGLYALKANYGFAGLSIESLKKFRSIESGLTGHGESHLFPQGVLISNGPLGSGLPQAQGLAAGDALHGRKRVTICALSDGGAMEGEAKEALAAIPGWAQKGRLAPFIVLISDNRTKLSGRIDTDAFSMDPTFQSMEKLGWKVLKLDDGHHLQACVATLEEALQQVTMDPTVPVLIHARTVKGKGHKKSEASSTGAHGFPLKKADELPAFLKEIYDGAEVPGEFLAWANELASGEARAKGASSPLHGLQGPGNELLMKTPSEKIQIGISAAMISCRRKGYPVVSVSADLQGSTGVADYQKAFPDATLDVGVAEANMISTAIGLSLSGYIPVVDTFAQFAVTKGALPLMMAGLSQGPVIGIFSHTGFQDAADGASHQALSFYAQVSAIPHVEVYSLSSSFEAETFLTQAIEMFAAERNAGQTPPTRIFFLGRENFPRSLYKENTPAKLGRSPTLLDTSQEFAKSVAIVAGGSLVSEALKASDRLREKKIGAVVIHAAAINHPDLETVQVALQKTSGRLVTVEEHRTVAGMGSMLIHALVQTGVSCKARSLGVGDGFGRSSYSALELYQKHGIDSAGITRAASEL